MIRFRYREDEQRYLDLRTEIYMRIARSLPAAVVSEVMRNFGKLEQMLQLEGVRQGVVAADLDGVYASRLSPLEIYARVYGTHDTPLVDVESEMAGGDRWAAEGPMDYAPQTLSEWRKEQRGNLGADPEPEVSSPPSPLVAQEPTSDDGDDGNMLERLLQESAPFMGGEEPEFDGQERPDMLDGLRSQIQTMQKGGWNPDNWKDLILGLHLSMHTDAGFLDIQLSTPMGQTVLAQCGIHIAPPSQVFLGDLQPSAAAEPEESQTGGGSDSEDDGTDPGPSSAD